ncbi:MAG TPA: hypothetical protein VKD90_19810 [Gemmataceae bacterium]|nr:hypothetical protein [Gemmataceae bacterium]
MTTLLEGDYVAHVGHRFVGMHAGYTRLPGLMELAGDLRGVRVQLPDGTIRVASEHRLEKTDAAEYGRYAASIGVVPRARKPATRAGRV